MKTHRPLAVLALLLLACCKGDGCGCCKETYCDGATGRQCTDDWPSHFESHTTNLGRSAIELVPGLFFSERRDVVVRDCAAQGQQAGRAQTCAISHASNSTEPFVLCVDATREPCTGAIPGQVDPARARCTDAGETQVCTWTTTGMVWTHDPSFECGAGKACFLASGKATCADSPTRQCDPAAYPVCIAGDRLAQCLGDVDGGTAVVSFACAPVDGGAACSARDAGAPRCATSP
jgi:hypothetical protein